MSNEEIFYEYIIIEVVDSGRGSWIFCLSSFYDNFQNFLNLKGWDFLNFYRYIYLDGFIVEVEFIDCEFYFCFKGCFRICGQNKGSLEINQVRQSWVFFSFLFDIYELNYGIVKRRVLESILGELFEGLEFKDGIDLVYKIVILSIEKGLIGKLCVFSFICGFQILSGKK